MSSNKQKNHENNQRTVSQKKVVPVAEESRQSKSPGAGPGKKEAGSGNMQQAGFGGSEEGERGGPGAQQAVWSSRQQAERIEARGEESRLGLPQQSGYGGLQQDQHAGSQESPTGPPGSWQSTNRGSRTKQAGASGSSPGAPGTKSKQRGGSK